MSAENPTPFKTHYTLTDAVFYQRQWHIEFILPDGTKHKFSSPSRESAVEYVNELIQYELERQELLPLYTAAVDALLHLATHHDGSSAKTAAQVLLSAYNSHNYQLAVVDLCNLDETNLGHAMAVLRGRAICMREPHNLIDNGGARFSELQKCWPGLHVVERYQHHYK